MIYDPLFTFLKNTKINPLPLSIGYGFSFIFAMIAMLYISGRKKRVKEYLKDPFGVFIWPFFVLAPIVIGYFLVSELGFEINNQLNKLNLSYSDYSLRLENRGFIFWIILFLASIGGVENVIRYHKNRPDLWLSKPKWLQPISTTLFNVPLGIMALILIISLIDQWVTFHRFMISGWLPISVYNSDKMYGIHWLYNIILTHVTIAVIASFSSLLALIREGAQKYSWIYKVIFLLSITGTGLAMYTLASDLNSLLQSINFYFFNDAISQLNQLTQITSNLSLGNSIQTLLILQETATIANMPNSMPIPTWLTGIISIRLLIFIPEIYTIIANYFGWKKFPVSIKKIIDLIK